MDRREFIQGVGVSALFVRASDLVASHNERTPIVKPPRLMQGDTVGLINPAYATDETVDIQIARETLAALGLKMKLGAHALDRYGYLAGKDADRAADVNAMFEDSDVQAVMAIRGGWGCSRILPLLDYDLIRRHPKILMGYSDITALLLAVHSRTGLITFHGPVATSTWNPFSVDYVRRILFNGEAVTLQNPPPSESSLARTKDRVQTVTGGKARGRLLGGNLSVLAGIIGSDYLPDWNDAILFVEDDGEGIYRIDRMLTELDLAGVLKKVRGFIFGKCTNCGPGEGYGSLTLEEVLSDHVKPLGIPAWFGAMIGHIENKFTVPVGIEAEIDADRGTIRLLEPAVV
jgi:muramoyltetrapeptide carboxypeptidase